VKIDGMRRNRRIRDTRPPLPLPTSLAEAVSGGQPFAAKPALEAGLVTRYTLRSRFTQIVPGVYATKGVELSRWDLIRAVGMWAPADAVIGGWSAAYLHGEHWFSADNGRGVVDVFTSLEPRVPRGVRERKLSDPVPATDVCELGGLRVTSPARTAVDVARWSRGVDRKICTIDSICVATGTELDAVAEAASRMRGQHGVSRAVRLLDACDAEAHSPQESLLRLRIDRSSLPRPTSQVEILEPSGELVTVADLAYIREKVAIFYDGKHHGDPGQWRRDIRINARLADLGWQVARIAQGMSVNEVIRHIELALARARRQRRS